MDIIRTLRTPPLQVECPHCGQAEDDALEVFDTDRLQGMQCAGCGQPFHFAVMECRACGDECLFSWTRTPPPERFDHLICQTCARSYTDHDTTVGSARRRA
jgi:transcription elongation factor Elf1